MTVWFTADTHFGHEAAIEHCQRPFASLGEMTEALMANWNDRVARGDVIYHLGDFALTWTNHTDFVDSLLRRLHGNKILIRGNHDRKATVRARGWSWVGDYKRVSVSGQKIVLCHYCIRSWHGIHRGAWHLYGHSHGKLVDDGGGHCMDVGVDCNDFRPVSFEEVSAFMSTRIASFVDHHNDRVNGVKCEQATNGHV